MRHACRQRCLLGQLVAVCAVTLGLIKVTCRGEYACGSGCCEGAGCTRAQLLRTASCVRWGQQPGQNVTFCECAWHAFD